MRVDLIYYPADAARLLVFSKKTRLLRSVADYQAVLDMPQEQLSAELDYVFKTIGSSLEFVDYVFLISGVTRAFTHQLVRHRVGVAYAQQSQRTVDVSDSFDYLATGLCKDLPQYHSAMAAIKQAYAACIDSGAHPQDARGLLPTNTLTNILFKVNLRTLSHIMNVRLCFKTQGEFQSVADAMRSAILSVHPWAEPVLRVHCAQYGNCIFPGFEQCPVRPALSVNNLHSINDLWKKSWDIVNTPMTEDGE